MKEGHEDNHGEEAGRLLRAFYAAGDPHTAEAQAVKILALMKPFLQRWTSQSTLRSADLICDAEDFFIEAQAKLLQELYRSQNGSPIINIFAYTKTVATRLCLGHIRKAGRSIDWDSEELENAPDPHSSIDTFINEENARRVYAAGWKALLECPINARLTILLALTSEQLQAWIGLPDPYAELAAMMEAEEVSARQWGSRLPVGDEEIAALLKTSVSYVQKLRSKTKKRIYTAAQQEAAG